MAGGDPGTKEFRELLAKETCISRTLYFVLFLSIAGEAGFLAYFKHDYGLFLGIYILHTFAAFYIGRKSHREMMSKCYYIYKDRFKLGLRIIKVVCFLGALFTGGLSLSLDLLHCDLIEEKYMQQCS